MSNKISDKNVANIEELIKEYKTYNDLDGIQDLQPYIRALQNILADYTRQKQINEEHRKLNGELRERVKELERNSNCDSVYAIKFATMQQQINEKDKRIQELKKENYVQKTVIFEKCIPKQAVIDKIEENSNIVKEIEEKIKEEENSGDICREYIRDLKRQKGLVKRDILTLQELLEGESK